MKMRAKFQDTIRRGVATCLIGSSILGARAGEQITERSASRKEQEKPITASTWKFDFGPGRAASEYTSVSANTLYTPEKGYGFLGTAPISGVERGGDNPLTDGFCTSDKPFFFTVNVPEGNYDVAITLGDSKGVSTTTIKAQSRRLMVEKAETAQGKTATHRFTINVRNSVLKNGERVRLKADEQGAFTWDGRLTLEFSNSRPCLDAITITPTSTVPTLFIAGDSTVCDQPREPWCAWGQMLPRFFKQGIAIANHAESGESLRSFVSERRLAKISEQVKAGDYLFIQFGHNDQKIKGEGVGAFTTYKAALKQFIAEAHAHGATPVLVTPVNRRTFDGEGKITNSLGDFPEAVRQTAAEEKVALIDLNAMSKLFYEALGPEKSVKAFVHYPANTYPGQSTELKDNTHFNSYGAYELARCVVEGIRSNHLAITRYLVADAGTFDPSHPDPVETWSLPASPLAPLVTPEGR